MKSLRRIASALAAFLAPLAAFAHPGHDGPHDFEWDFGHFAAHPIATTTCLAVLGLAGWAVWKLASTKRDESTTKR
ncbi:MAG TPA: hypothetical protein VFJ90_01830 [Candidatus Didemnitutus sp.]|nr:hypothetical protein [Candidatus Didemnitutus sp.]